MRIFLVIAVLIISIKVYGQPGPFGGQFSFRFSDENNQILKKESGLTAWPELKKDTLHSNRGMDAREAKWPSRDVKWADDSTLCYELIPTPMGGCFPQGFIIAASYNNDTMRIQGLDNQRFSLLSIDNIPFLQGNYYIPSELIPFLNIKWKKGMKPPSLDWRNFEVDKRHTSSFAVLEKVGNKSFTNPDTMFQEYQVFVNNTKKGVIRYNKLSKSWDTLFQNISAYPVNVVNNKEIAIITLGYSAFLFSDSQSDNWKLAFFKEPAKVKGAKIQPLRIDSLWLSEDNIFIKANRYYSFYYDRFKFEDSIFQVHINLPDTSVIYQKIKAGNEEEMSTKIISWLEAFIWSHERASRENNCARYPERLYNYLENGAFYEPDGGGLNHLLLTLSDGKFYYKGTNQMHRSYEEYAYYDSKGSYSYNDSTITFFESAEYQNLEFDSINVDFAPRGTYYWYFSDNLMILTQHKVHESINSYHMYQGLFWFKKE